MDTIQAEGQRQQDRSAPAELDIIQSCREIVSRALDFSALKTSIRGQEAIVVALRRGQRAPREYFHYGLAKEVGSFLGRTEPALKAVYLYEPEEMPEEFYEENRPISQSLDLIAWVMNGKGALVSLAQKLDSALVDEVAALLGSAGSDVRPFLNMDVVDDRDVQDRIGRGALITSIYTRPTKVWGRYVIRLNAEFCGRCRICANVCPFDAIALSPEATSAKIDVDKCQLCGICYSACPSGAIEASYYDFGALVQNVQTSVRANGFKSIALTCRGSTPAAQEIEQIIGAPGFTPICLPCVGRIPSEFFLKAIGMGIERIAVIPCADGHCRFEDGNRNIRNRILLLQPLLRALNYDPHVVTLHQVMGPVATVDPELCTGCGTCMSVCQYGAVGKNGHGGSVLFVAEVDPALCQGCGACAASCPSRAIALSRFADVQVLAQIQAALAVPAPAAAGLPTVPHSNGSRVLGFRCNWCSYDDSDLPFDGLSYGAGINAIRVPCVGRIDPLHVVWAFLSGADGVFLGGCPPDNCRYARGSGRAEERFSDLKTLLDSHGIDSRRLRLEWIERDTPNRYSDALRSFAGQIAQLGVLSTR